ncbi:polysaccharide deacetylase family protein [Microbacterium sp. SD291]|uniref:polysaccharide deacetylase family protein n=1 Tax=Microbacterium sp. SD291 TaxID=2782007 RepID=UPI001A970DA2|nr:polysaccharide deacetylase family protein [Microbacterium sp. SD291]MBO0980094.1 polysaccharide deacetylase family protein [Microbacterium sp. SD291]
MSDTMPRDLRGYGEHPPVLAWPNGSRVAVSIVLNIEEGAERSVARGDAADDLGGHWLRHPALPDQRNLDLESAFEYGSRAGVWRVLRTLRRHKALATAFCCTVALEANPRVAAALVRDGHEIAAHGHKWDVHTHLSPEEEESRIHRVRDEIAAITGAEVTTWYSRDGITPATRRIMSDSSFAYDSNSFNDDLPHDGADGIDVPVLPYAGDTNDSALLSQYPTARAFGSYLTGALDCLLDDHREGPSVLSIGLHPRLIGRPSCIGALDGLLTRASETGAWIAPRREIVAAWSRRDR